MLGEYDIDQLNPRPNPYAKDVKKQRTIKITPSINGNESIVTEYTVILTWDDEAKIWVATSPDVTGLVLESESLDTLMNRVKEAVPELLELNSQKTYGTTDGGLKMDMCQATIDIMNESRAEGRAEERIKRNESFIAYLMKEKNAVSKPKLSLDRRPGEADCLYDGDL